MEPKILFKYRPIDTVEQLIRVLDSINNNRIFFPTYKMLNDPLESSGYVVELSGYAGISIFRAIDEEDHFVKQRRQEYKILSLTEDCFSPSMWAHYTNGYTGICIGYWKKDTFESARKINYICKPQKNPNAYGIEDVGEPLDKEIYESFFYKHSDWDYEKEWRIVSKQEEPYFNYNPDNLACIIFGGNMSKETRAHLVNNITPKVPMYYSKNGYRSFSIKLLPLSYEIELNGAFPPFINDVKMLVENIQTNYQNA